jgi:hypothetical protein
MMSPQNRITPLSNALFHACTVLAFVLPCVVIGAILKGWYDPATVTARFPAIPDGTPVTAFQGVLMAAVGLVSVYPMVAALLAMRRLFGRYRRGEILTDACADDILRTGHALFWVAAATVIVPTLQILVLSWNNGAGQRILSIGLDGGTLGFLFSGLLLVTIGWVMREAARAVEENKGFV